MQNYKSRIRWLEDLTPPRIKQERFPVSCPTYRGQTLEAIRFTKGRFRFDEISERQFYSIGDAVFYRSFARALLHLAEAKNRLILLDKHDANEGIQWGPNTGAPPPARNVIVCHHTLQLKRSEAALLWRAQPQDQVCEWSPETWDISNQVWKPDCLDVRIARDTLFLAGSTPTFVELARIAVSMSRCPTSSHYRLYVLERNAIQPDLVLLKP